METSKTILLFFALCAVLLLSGMNCKKDPTKNAVLPPATQEGKNTIGFILNNEVWVPYARCGSVWTGGTACGKIFVDYLLSKYYPYNSMSFSCRRKREKAGKSSSLSISSTLIGNISSIGDKTDSIGVDFIGENSSGNSDYYIGPLTGSKFIITKLDTVNRIISGEFELILGESNGSGKQITLKNGRFDFKMNACLCDSK